MTEEDDEELDGTERTWYRGMVARGNCLAQGRCDIQNAVKELSRGMQNPTKRPCQGTEETGKVFDWENQVRGYVPKTREECSVAHSC